jgi:hypothetical protein
MAGIHYDVGISIDFDPLRDGEMIRLAKFVKLD